MKKKRIILFALILLGSVSCREVGKEPLARPNPIQILSVDLQGTASDRSGSTVTVNDPGGGAPQQGPSPLAFTLTVDTTGLSSVSIQASDDSSPPNAHSATLIIE
jgi:hypothetical protein